MNRLSLLAGSIPPNPKQSIKEAAFLEYLRSFSLNGLQILENLETQFNKDYSSTNNLSDDFKQFQNIKTLIGLYEMFVLEINDSCEFIEVPQFGTCLLKLFIQLIGIVKWSLKQLILEKQNNFDPIDTLNSNQSIDVAQMSQTTNSLMSYFTTSKSKQQNQKNLRNTFNGKININTVQREGVCSECQKNLNPLNIFKVKQHAAFQLRNINEEIMRISKEYAEQERKAQKQEEERKQLQNFIEKRQKRGKIQNQFGLGDHKRSEQALAQILIILSRKGQAIKKFADMRMTSIIGENKVQATSDQEYENLKVETALEMKHKLNFAKQKLANLFKQHVLQYEKCKKETLVDAEVQTCQKQTQKIHQTQQQKLIKKLKNDIKKLEKDVENEKGLAEDMKKLLGEKTKEFQTQILQCRNDFVNSEMRHMRQTKRTRLENPGQKTQTSSIYTERPSAISININGCEEPPSTNNINTIKEQDDSRMGLNLNDSMQIVRPSFLKPTKRHVQPKTLFKYKKITDHSMNCSLSFSSSVVNETIQPGIKMISASLEAEILKRQLQLQEMLKRTKKAAITEQFCMQTSIQRKNESEEEWSLKSKKRIADEMIKTAQQSPQTFRRMNANIKKKSATYRDYSMTKKKEVKKEEYNLVSLVSKSKSSKLLQRLIKHNTVHNGNIQNNFESLGLAEGDSVTNHVKIVSKSYIKRYADLRHQTMSRQQSASTRKRVIQTQASCQMNRTAQVSNKLEKNSSRDIRFNSFEGLQTQDSKETKENKENMVPDEIVQS